MFSVADFRTDWFEILVSLVVFTPFLTRVVLQFVHVFTFVIAKLHITHLRYRSTASLETKNLPKDCDLGVWDFLERFSHHVIDPMALPPCQWLLIKRSDECDEVLLGASLAREGYPPGTTWNARTTGISGLQQIWTGIQLVLGQFRMPSVPTGPALAAAGFQPHFVKRPLMGIALGAYNWAMIPGLQRPVGPARWRNHVPPVGGGLHGRSVCNPRGFEDFLPLWRRRIQSSEPWREHAIATPASVARDGTSDARSTITDGPVASVGVSWARRQSVDELHKDADLSSLLEGFNALRADLANKKDPKDKKDRKRSNKNQK